MTVIQPELPADPVTANAIRQILDALNGGLDRDNFVAALPFPLKPVAVLPAPAFDGQLCLFQTAAMEAAGVAPWLLRHRAKNQDGTPNLSGFKWEPLGEPAALLATDVNGSSSRTNVAYGDPTAGVVGPSLVVPLAGDYLSRFGGVVFSNLAGQPAYMAIDSVGSAGAADAEALMGYSQNDPFDSAGGMREIVKVAAAGGTIKAVYRAAGGAQVSAENRWLHVTPRRVG